MSEQNNIQESLERLISGEPLPSQVKQIHKTKILEAILSPEEIQIYSRSNELAQFYDKEVILESIEYMYQGFLAATGSGEIPYRNSLSVYVVFKRLKQAFS